MNNIGYKFEQIVKEVFGKPKTDIYFSNYYDSSNDEKESYKYILYTICIYLINYKDLSLENKKKLIEYVEDKEKYLNNSECINMINHLVKILGII